MINITSKIQIAKIHRMLVAVMIRIEKKYTRSIEIVLNKQYRESASSIRKGNYKELDINVDKYAGELQKKISTVYGVTGFTFGEMIFDEMRKQGLITSKKLAEELPMEFIESIRQWSWMQAGLEVTNINSTTRRLIRKVLQKGLLDNKTNYEMAKELRAKIPFNKARATRIVRTETHTASMKAFQEGVERSPFKHQKEWAAVMDSRTRITHVKANGQKVDVDKFFIVNGYEMEYPGDSMAPAGEIVNCRCVAMYHTV